VNYSAPEFLLLFPIFAAVYWAWRSQRARLSWLLIGSLAFYAYGDLAGVPVLLAVGAFAWSAGLLLAAARRRRWVLAAGIGLLVLDLAIFKYLGFIGGIVAPERAAIGLVAPLGISFFTFEAIAYLVDIYRGVTVVERSPFRFAQYITLFPHLISGPIMRPNDLLPQFRRAIAWDGARAVSGLQLFVEGLIKKRLIADPCGIIADRVFAFPDGAGGATAWLAAVAYTLQIYGDFAGYTDMGRGIGRMLGLELPLNFAAPYTAGSISEFWRRWHISLSSWLRDYVYIPLGGNRRGRIRADANLMATMLIGGLWHGAGWTFVLWGAYHGALLALERHVRWSERLPRWLAGAATLFLVLNGWVLFRSRDFTTWSAMLHAMYLSPAGRSMPTRDALFVVGAAVIVLGAMVVSRVAPELLAEARRPTIWSGAAYAFGTPAVLFFAPTVAAPFIYFRF
jgi:alginate O-acetyltransferase complex protein AlgI